MNDIELFKDQLNDIGIKEMWFQRDIAICYTTKQMDLLRRFPNCMIFKYADVNLTPFHFFLRGLINSKAYANKSQTIPELKAKIIEIEPSDLVKIFENLIKRVIVCEHCNRNHLTNIVFHNQSQHIYFINQLNDHLLRFLKSNNKP